MEVATSSSHCTKSCRISSIPKMIGEGGYGRVFRVNVDNDAYAVKVMVNATSRNCIDHELNALKMLTLHENIISFVTHQMDHLITYLVLELAEYELYAKVVNGPLCEDEAREKFKQMLAAITHIHRIGIVHRDIKLENWLIKNNVTILTDFGLAHIYSETHTSFRPLLRDAVGSKAYCLPEILLRRPYDGYACDAWSVGVCLFSMLTGFFHTCRHHSQIGASNSFTQIAVHSHRFVRRLQQTLYISNAQNFAFKNY